MTAIFVLLITTITFAKTDKALPSDILISTLNKYENIITNKKILSEEILCNDDHFQIIRREVEYEKVLYQKALYQDAFYGQIIKLIPQTVEMGTHFQYETSLVWPKQGC